MNQQISHEQPVVPRLVSPPTSLLSSSMQSSADLPPTTVLIPQRTSTVKRKYCRLKRISTISVTPCDGFETFHRSQVTVHKKSAQQSPDWPGWEEDRVVKPRRLTFDDLGDPISEMFMEPLHHDFYSPNSNIQSAVEGPLQTVPALHPSPVATSSLLPSSPLQSVTPGTIKNLFTLAGQCQDITSTLTPVLTTKCLYSLEESKVLLTTQSYGQLPTDDINLTRDFTMHGLIGSGAFANVYKVLDKHDKVFALKRMKSKMRSKQERERWLREAFVLQLISSPDHNLCSYVPKFFAAWQENEHFHLLMELTDHGTVGDVIQHCCQTQSALSMENIWHIVHDTCSGITHLHSFQFIHMDIKPSNMLISKSGSIKIGDFGLVLKHGSENDGQEGDAR
jgi:tRNA A-37 threonylcarbamoyl transferase component Bud32